MAQEVIVPVKVQLENLQNIAKEMHTQLGTLQINSSGYKKLENVIINIEKRIQQLQVISSRPFIDTKQFTAVSKEIIGIQDDLTKIRIEAGKVKFSDLSLDASQKAKLQEFDTQIKSINDQLKQVKDSAKNTFFETDIGKAWKLNHTEDAGKTFTQITSIIEREVAKQEAALKNAEQAQAAYQDRLASNRRLATFIKSGHALNQENLGEQLYNQIFNASGNFKSGGRTLLQTWLEQQFKLDSAVVQTLTQDAGKKVQEAFSEVSGHVESTLKQERARINANLTDEKTRTNNGKSYAADILSAQASLNNEKAAKEAVNETNIKVAKTESDLTKELVQAKTAREEYTQSLTRAAIEQLQMSSSCDAARAQLNSLNHTVDTGKAKLASLDQATSKLQGISNFVNRYVGAYAIIRKVTTAIRNAFNNIQELDKVITSIAVVTNMSQEDLWNKVGQYTQMAQEYGVATKDVYTVSQIFYQQGLQTAQVMDLTTETLKMAKIAGIDYSQAANAMTVAVRAFKIEMDEAQRVTDTYSALAAKFAVDSAEIANAMEKTASSAASVGMSLESTSAFISVMEQTTRESAQNIGSALKSIISRYGEMKASPEKLLNIEGEEVAFNKVDTALASIGISIKDAAGQFRDFDDVIMELAEKWNTLDNNTQRYIATVMAGNRQQSRFIALVSNYDELSRAMSVANNAENASIVQVAKTMDSLESKANQVKNAFSQLYLDLHIEEGLKSAYDWLTRILKTLGNLGTLNGVLPTLANIVGFGTGTKSLLKGGMDWIQQKKGKYDIETTEAQQKIDDIRAQAEKDIQTKWKIHADLSEMTAQKAVLEAQQTNAAQAAYTAYQRAGGTVNEQSFKESLQRGTAKTTIGLATGADPGDKQAAMNAVDAYQSTTNSLNNLNNSISQLESALQRTANSGDQASDGLEQVRQSGTTTGQSLDNLGANTNNANTAESSKAAAAVQVAQADYDAAVKARDKAQADLNAAREVVNSARQAGHTMTGAAVEAAKARLREAEANRIAAEKALQKAEADERGSQSEEEEIRANQRSAQSEDMEADANSKKSGLSLTDWGNGNAAKIVGVATGLARIAGTAITAIGASTQDKSTDGIEHSKIWTGIGNGVSSAGMGASMGMALGPWGAAVGAIGGFLLGGLGAIIDGATMTLEEQLELEKAEAKKASDEALKAQAKVLDLDSSIDNIKKLQNAMYNSTEDMEAYQDAMNTMASTYPSLVSSYDAAGNAIIDLNQAEILLAQTRLEASEAANSAAKAEAKTRKTTIDILTEAHNITDNLAVNKNNSNYSVSHAYNQIHRFSDNAGGIHDFELSNNYWEALSTALNTVNKDLNSISLNDLIEFITTYNGPQQYVSQLKDRFSQFTINESTGAISGGYEYTYNNDVKNINKKLEASKDVLNLNPSEDLPSGAEYIYAFMGWDKEVKLTAERIKEFDAALIKRTDNYKNIVNTLDKSLPIIDSQESLDRALLNENDYQKATKISESKFASKLIANQLENIAQQEFKINAGEWSRSEDNALNSAYETAKTEATNIVISWFTSLSDDALDQTLAAFGSMDQYLSVEDMLQSLGYADKNSFIKNSGLEEEQAQQLLVSWQQSFIDANQANRDRILNTIYNDTKTGINADLEGLAQIASYEKELGPRRRLFGNTAVDIANLFKGETPEIISKYADYFTNQLLEIDKLAQQGYTQLASNRLTALKDLSDALSNLDSSKEQQDLFSIITSTDFTNLDSLLNTQKAIKQYRTKNNITSKIDGTYQALQVVQEAEELLIFNVNTLADNLSSSISEAAKNIDSVLSSNNSGFDLSKALEGLESLNVGKSAEEAFNFNDIFRFDATLGKYVYTVKGLKAAITQVEGDLNEQVTQLRKMQGLYQSNLISEKESEDFQSSYLFKDTSSLLGNITGYRNWNTQTQILYQGLAEDFMKASEYTEKTWENFVKYIQERKEAGDLAVEATEQQLAAYKANKPNQLFQNIDWASLALKTDYSGTNKELMQQLAIELGLMDERTGEWVRDKARSWETVVDEYLNKLYGVKDSPAKRVARAKINDDILKEKISNYQTALSEILNNSNGIISQASKELARTTGIDISNIGNSASNAITAASKFLKQLAEQIGQAGYTLEQYNQDASSILESTLAQKSKGKALLDFASGDIGADSLETLANTLQLKLTDLVDVTNGQVIGGLDQFLSYDSATSTYKIQTSFSNFVDALEARFGLIIDRTSQAYIDTLKSYNDSVITAHTQIKDNVDKEIQGIKSIKPKDWLNLTQLSSEIKKASKTSKKIAQNRGKNTDEDIEQFLQDDTFFNEFNKLLNKSGAYLEDGILKLSDNVDFLGLAQTIADYTLEAGIELSDEISDFMKSILESYTTAISKGIEGGMSSAERTDLTEKAKSFNIKLTDVDFTETAEGLQLSEEAAIRLYRTMSSVDKLQGRILFEKLSKRLVENNIQYKTTNSLLSRTYQLQNEINKLKSQKDSRDDTRLKQYQAELAVAKEIAATRLIQEDSSWNFMSESAMPASFSNALNYWGTWVSVQKDLDESAKSGKMDPTKFVTLFKHIEDLARAEGETINFLDHEIGEGGLTLDVLMDQLWAAIEYEDDGTAYLSIEKMKELGYDLSEGSAILTDGVWTAAQNFGTKNGQQLENIHNFYKELLALRRDLGELDFDDFTDDKGAFSIEKLQTRNEKAYNDLMKFGEKIKVNGKDFATLMTQAGTTWKPGGTNYELIKSIFTLMSSDEWDVETGYQTIGENLMKSGFTGELDLGDVQIAVKEGKVITKADEAEDWEYNGDHFATSEEALNAMLYKDVQDIQKLQGNKDNTIKIGDTIFIIEYEEDGSLKLVSRDGKTTYSSAQEAAEKEYEKYVKTQKQSNKPILSERAWKIKNKLEVVPTLTQQKGILTNEQLTLLRQSSIEELQAEFKASPLEFAAKYNIDLRGGEVNWDDIKRQIESDATAKSVQVGITNAFSGVNGTEIGTQLGAGIAKALTDIKADVDTEDAKKKLADLKKEAEAAPKPKPISLDNNSVSAAMDAIKKINEAASAPVTKKVYVEEGSSSSAGGNVKADLGFTSSSSKFQTQLANAKGTLMGELGPEMVVSKGHYFLVGQQGPEMVDLADDAIVFNHLQTQSLLGKGFTNTRGKTITNERNAVAYATGSRNGGVAKESLAEAAQRTIDTTGADIHKNGAQIARNRSSNNNKNADKAAAEAMKAFIKEVDRWYNYLQEIARLERDITKEEKLRSEYQSHMTAKGKEYADSLLDTLPLLRQQAAEHRLLANDQEKWLKGYVAEQADSPWSKFWTIDEHGQEKYNLAGFEKLEQMVGTDKYGKPNMTPEEQMAYLKSLGVTDEWFQYDSSGNAIDTSTPDGVVTAIQSLWEHMDKTRETVQTHLDSIDEHNKAAIDNQTTINGHLKSIEDNQIKVENSVLKAVEEIHQRMIDDVQDQRDAIEASSKALINGLSDQLSKEQDMYSRQQDSNELSTLQRRLSILQRSGGSASEIAKLQQEINSKQRDAYFEAQQSEIDTLQDAVDAQLERLDKQIELMTETLEYEKQNGLLWGEVYTVLNQTPDEITNFITTNTEEHWGKSPTELAQVNRETLFQAEWFKEIIDRVGGVDNLVAENDYSAVDSELEKKVAEIEKANAAAKEAVQATANAASSATNSSGNGNGSDITGYYYQSAGEKGHYLVAMHADGSKTGNNKQLQPHTFNKLKCTKCGYQKRPGKLKNLVADTDIPVIKNEREIHLASGGLITHPTRALIGETGKPEAVLNPEQTAILRNDILSNKPTSLLSLLTDFRDAYENLPGASAYNTTNNDGVVIQQATVEMHVNRIANDYDAQRAGEQALDQMLAIARKTQAQNRVGR